MAKLGEGDARWIVDERVDGTNVNNWHWTEKDVLPWARRRLQELLGGQTFAPSNGVVIKTGAVTVTGEAIINNRKNKLIPTYELEVRGQWTGEGGPVGEGSVAGTFVLPYLADENADEDPEFKVSTSTEGAVQAACKEAFMSAIKPKALKEVRQFVAEIAAGGPSAGPTPTKDAAAVRGGPAAPAHKSTPGAATTRIAEHAPPVDSSVGETATVRITEKFYARAGDLYECFTNPARIQAYLQSPAQVEPCEGGTFSIFGGAVDAKFTALEAPRLLRLDWRFRNWPDGAISKVDLRFEEPQEGTTLVHLTQRGVPRGDRFGNPDVPETTRKGWQQQIFQRIRAVFGYGLGL